MIFNLFMPMIDRTPAATLAVNALTGSTVTAALDGEVTTLTESAEGVFTGKFKVFGTYTVTATLDTRTASTTLEITEAAAYEVTLEYIPILTITGNGYYSGNTNPHAKVTVDGQEYTSAATLEVAKGTAVKCYATQFSMPVGTTAGTQILLNGVDVVETGREKTYTYTVTKDAEIQVQAATRRIKKTTTSGLTQYVTVVCGYISITDE